MQAYWLDRKTVAIAPADVQATWTYRLLYAGSAIDLTIGALSAAQLQKYPQLRNYSAFYLPVNSDVATLKAALKEQLTVGAFDGSTMKYSIGIQTAGVLDDLFYYTGPLGYHGSRVSLWAPTAQSVQLMLFRGGDDTEPVATVPMTEANGVWSGEIDRSWRNQYYLFNVRVYVPSLQQIVNNLVTDPYSTDLALNGVKSRFTDLSDPDTKPDHWDEHRSPEIRSKNDLSIWELHVRDFSAGDLTVPVERRGTYLAFQEAGSNGMRHLRRLADAGLKAVHLLPTFHIASINEDKATWQTPGDLTGFPPDSTQQQAAVAAVQSQDAYNWGYDPVHYMAPEGSYAVNPDNRVKEYRAMVQALHGAGLRVIQDQVFNHTSSSGQAVNSVLDKIVPGYYYRLSGSGVVLSSSCCADTASEHLMMEKLMIDSIVQNARQYRIDGFRFDLMGFHFVYNMRHIQDALSQLTLENDGVDGSKIYLYGEGWNNGETANNALGPNASQLNMYGTGIGTFNDRIRNAVRGGGPFSDPRVPGFASGGISADSDLIRAGLAGNMRDFSFTNIQGQVTTAGSLNYSGQPVGYTASPIESVNYCSVHDNQTLFDALQLKCSASDNIAARARRQVVALSIIALGQGIPLFHAGDEMLRSKSMDNNSYNAGDWFNKLDFTYQTNNWGVGLPLAADNQYSWPIMQPLLANAALQVTSADILNTLDAFEAMLRVRASSELFRMQTLAEVQNKLRFFHTIPGVIGMRLRGDQSIVVIFNATTNQVAVQDTLLKGPALNLHPALRDSSDPIVQSATFDHVNGIATVPALTTAVFIS